MGEKNEDINDALEQLRRLSANKELRERLYMEERRRRDKKAIMDYKLEEASQKGMEQRN